MTALYRITMSILIVLIIISIVTCALSVVAAQTPRTLVNDANVKITKSGVSVVFLLVFRLYSLKKEGNILR